MPDPLYLKEVRELVARLEHLTEVFIRRAENRRGRLSPEEKACVDSAGLLSEQVAKLQAAADAVQARQTPLAFRCRELLQLLDKLESADSETAVLLLEVRTKIDSVLAIAAERAAWQ